MEMISFLHGDEIVEKVVKVYCLFLRTYRACFNKVSEMYKIDLMEGNGLRNSLADHKGVSSFEYDLFLYFVKSYSQSEATKARCSHDFPGIETELSRTLMIREFMASINPEGFTGTGEIRWEWLITILPKYFNYLITLAQHMNGTLSRLKIVQIYRALLISQELRNCEIPLPNCIANMLFVVIQSAFESEFKVVDKKRIKIEKWPLENHVDIEKSKVDEFFSVLSLSFEQWEICKLDCSIMEFTELTPPFIELLHGFHELAKETQKLVLNEYCRINGIMLRFTKLISEDRFGQFKDFLVKVLKIMRESFRFLQGPRRKKIFGQTHRFSEDHEQFFSRMNYKFFCAFLQLFPIGLDKDIAGNLPLNSRERISMEAENALFISKEKLYFSILDSALVVLPKELSFNIDFSLAETEFVDERKDHYVTLPLLTEEFMANFFLPGDNKRRRLN